MKAITRWFNRTFRNVLYVGYDDKRIQEILDSSGLYSVCYNERTGRVVHFA